MRRKCLVGFVAVAAIACVATPRRAHARVRLENICTIYGQREIKLVGIGLVVGLDGTGDGGKSAPTIRALAQVMKLMNTPVADINELKDAKNVAVVHIDATIPRTGLRYGQKIDCHVSAPMAKSLRGGRLLVSPVEEADISNDLVVGLASGGVQLENTESLRTGKIPGGVILHRNYPVQFIDRERGNLITLMLNPGHASFYSSNEIAEAVNNEFSAEANNEKIAWPVGPGFVEVKLPKAYEDAPVKFVATMLDVSIEHPHTQARVVVNSRTGTVIITGEVEISPVLIAKNGLKVRVGPAGPAGDQPAGGFIEFKDPRNPDSSQQLKALVDSLNELRVPTKDIIEILRDLHKSGKLHAAYIEN